MEPLPIIERSSAREGEKLLAAMYAGELPRERLMRMGPEALKDQELLAIVLGTGYRGRHVGELAKSVLADHPTESFCRYGAKGGSWWQPSSWRAAGCRRDWACSR